MKPKRNIDRAYSIDWFNIFLISVIIFGILIRLIHLDKRVYWGDEIVTSIRIAGYRFSEVLQEISNKSILSAEDLLTYQNTSSSRGLNTTIQGLVSDEPQHAPIYFVALHLLVKLFKNFSNSITQIRSFSVFLSLLSFPSLYWLCFELFNSVTAGLIATAMVATSPFYYVYAQEARPPVLWILCILLSSALLLRALRLNTKLSWVAYAASVVFSLYSFLFSVFVLIGHGFYILLIKGLKPNTAIIRYLLVVCVGVSAFMPWLLKIASNLSTVSDSTSWSSEKIGSFQLLRMVINNLRDVFFNIGEGYTYLTFLLLILIGFSFLFLIKTAPKSVWAFVLLLISVTIVFLLIPDLVNGVRRSAASRYFIAPYLGINLSLAYLFSVQTKNLIWQWKKCWQAIVTILLVIGISSCIIISQSEISFNQATYRNSAVLAQVINKYENPLVITGTQYFNNIIGAIGISHYLKPSTRFKFVPDASQLNDSTQAKNIFVYGKDIEFLLKYLGADHIEVIYKSDYEGLWQIQIPP